MLFRSQGWARRGNRTESTMYGDTYIKGYKDILTKYFEEGQKNSSKKMNPSMMHEKLKKQFPHKFSLPGETQIKQLINSLFMQSKKGNNNNNLSDDDEVFDQVVEYKRRYRWEKLLQEILDRNPTALPEVVYKELLSEVPNEHRGSLPEKPVVKRKISALKARIRRKVMRSIVSS